MKLSSKLEMGDPLTNWFEELIHFKERAIGESKKKNGDSCSSPHSYWVSEQLNNWSHQFAPLSAHSLFSALCSPTHSRSWFFSIHSLFALSGLRSVQFDLRLKTSSSLCLRVTILACNCNIGMYTLHYYIYIYIFFCFFLLTVLLWLLIKLI